MDVGSLDCTLHLGFPGSVASLWQQAGRAGRREQACLGIYLGWDGPLDQVSCACVALCVQTTTCVFPS